MSLRRSSSNEDYKIIIYRLIYQPLQGGKYIKLEGLDLFAFQNIKQESGLSNVKFY